MTILRVGELLESRHMTGILAYLRMNGPRYKSEIYRNVSSNPRMLRKLEQLEECGIVTMTAHGNRISVELTDSGEKVADFLFEIENEVYGEPLVEEGRGPPPRDQS